MNKQEFCEEITKVIINKMPSEYNVSMRDIEKNNGIVLTGLIINDGKTNISPTIYLDYYFDQYAAGHSIDSLVDEIIEKYNRFSMEDNFDISVFTDFEQAKNKLVMKVVNHDSNENLLQNVPHVKYMDLDVVFMVLLESDNLETSSILVRNAHLDLWGKTPDDLYKIAYKNTKELLGTNIKSLSDVVQELWGKNSAELNTPFVVEPDPLDPTASMYVITNNIKLYGATNMLYDDVLDELATKLGTDLIIIPSSVHEVLALPATIDSDLTYIKELVGEVNSTEVDPEDILSNNLYMYNVKAHKLTDVDTYYKDKEENKSVVDDNAVEPEGPARHTARHR